MVDWIFVFVNEATDIITAVREREGGREEREGGGRGGRREEEREGGGGEGRWKE